MKKMELEAIRERDKVNSAYHEAGHAVVALSMGLKWVRAHIEPCEPTNPYEEKLYNGQCSYFGASPEQEPVIGLAGEVSRMIHLGEYFGVCDESIDIDELSETDLAAIGKCDDLDEAESLTYAILTENWVRVEKIAAALMREESLSDGMILELWNS